jgi:hypothetical protein
MEKMKISRPVEEIDQSLLNPQFDRQSETNQKSKLEATLQENPLMKLMNQVGATSLGNQNSIRLTADQNVSVYSKNQSINQSKFGQTLRKSHEIIANSDNCIRKFIIPEPIKNEYFQNHQKFLPPNEFMELLKLLSYKIGQKPSEISFDYSYFGCQSKLTSNGLYYHNRRRRQRDLFG